MAANGYGCRTAMTCLLVMLLSSGRGRAFRGDGRVTVYEGGIASGFVDEEDARLRGLTLLDLGDSFIPPVLADEPELGELGRQPYGDTYRALADGRPVGHGSADGGDLELYGIFPTFRVLRARILDAGRHACDAGVDRAALAAFPGRMFATAAPDRGSGPKAIARRAAVEVVQALLRCEGLLSERAGKGSYDAATMAAVRRFQRRHMMVAWGVVDATTRSALLASSSERDYLAVLRALRERVVAATGLIEDGTARAEQGTVLGRKLDDPNLRATDSYGPLPNGAPDLVAITTDAAARAIGWESAEATRQWLTDHAKEMGQMLRVAVRLPIAPSYHSEHMDLRVVIDRGDVWYEYPYRADGSLRTLPVQRRPTLVLWARTPSGEIPLVRWNTTIGGWQAERRADGSVVLRYKNSEVGPREWRGVIASPAWLPPPTTPDAELVHRAPAGRYVLKRDLMEPGYQSAYGLVMMSHDLLWTPHGGAPQYVTRGVRTHGSVSYGSILRGNSHGCHRLFNHLAIRLASFLIAHRAHEHHGNLRVRYSRHVRYRNVAQTLSITTRGYAYELTPPVTVNVLEGRIRGVVRAPPIGSRPLPPGYRF